MTVALFPRQMRFVQDQRRFPGYVGGIGSGKSFAGGVKALKRFGHPGLGGVFAPSYPMLRDATQRTLFTLLDTVGIAYEHHKGENRLTILKSGHEVIFRSLDNPDSVRGPNLEWAWIDEASLVTKEASNIVNGRVRVGDHPQVWKTFTPKGRNWCWEEYERDATGDESDPVHPLYRVKTTENPELPADFVDSLGYSGRFAEQELGGEFVAFEGVVYPSFNRPDHVRPHDTTDWRPVMAIDIGTRNPTAILTGYQGDDRWHIAREVYRRGMSSDEIIDAITAEADAVQPEVIYIDPSANDYILTLQRKEYPARKANNDVTYGIGVVTAELANGMTIDPSCVNLIAELETYHYREGGRTETDKPVKEFDHACDAVRYMCASDPIMVEQVYFA